MKTNLLKRLSSKKGFTLIELLIVMAIIGVFAAGILILIDPVDKINAANDSKAQGHVGAIGRAADAYATSHNGFYPATLAEMETSGDIKRVPVAVSGYTYTFTALPASCTGGTTCTSVTMTSTLLSKRYTSASQNFWRFESTSGKNCGVATAATACP